MRQPFTYNCKFGLFSRFNCRDALLVVVGLAASSRYLKLCNLLFTGAKPFRFLRKFVVILHSSCELVSSLSGAPTMDLTAASEKEARASTGAEVYTTTLQLEPVRDPFAKPRSLEDLENAMHDMLHGLEELHSNSYTHRDLRWDNCIKVMVTGEWKWVIIDLEEAEPLTELWDGDYLTFWDAKTLEGDIDQKKRYTEGSDIYQLGKLFGEWLDHNYVGDEETRRLIRSRAEKMQQERTKVVLQEVCKKGCKRCGKFDAKL